MVQGYGGGNWGLVDCGEERGMQGGPDSCHLGCSRNARLFAVWPRQSVGRACSPPFHHTAWSVWEPSNILIWKNFFINSSQNFLIGCSRQRDEARLSIVLKSRSTKKQWAHRPPVDRGPVGSHRLPGPPPLPVLEPGLQSVEASSWRERGMFSHHP